MAGQLVGGTFFSAFLQVAFDRLATPEVIDFLGQWKIDQDDVENLKLTITKVQTLTDEAEVEQFTNDNVKVWLYPVKQLLYDADDVLEDYVTEILRVKLESESQNHQHPDRQHQVCNPVSLTPSSSDTIFSSWFNSGIESAVKTFDELKDVPHKLLGIKEFRAKVKEINEKLKGVAKDGFDLGLGSTTRAGSSRRTVFDQRPATSSLVNKNKVFGRENEKNKIIELLKDKTTQSDNNFSVLPIVGKGGLGKTTLAQLVYTDESIMSHFEIRAWVCVSEQFDIVRITKEILESINNRKPESDLLDGLQNQLQATLSKKKFLLVLDDVWHMDLTFIKWENLQTPFAAGARGSKILVTTRDHKACVNLLRKHAFVDGNSWDVDGKLKMFGHKIVEKCKGLPLAVKTIAGLLRDRTEDGQWEAVLKDKIWDIEEGQSEILPSLMLSYHHLPPHLKRCFAYCALFPKDYIFDWIMLIRLWMAEGFVQPKGTKQLEDIGFSQCLAIKSFSESSDISGSSKFVMHDLLHDLAEFVSTGIYFRNEVVNSSKIPTAPRHLSFDYEIIDNHLTNFGDIKNVKSLRTLLNYSVIFYGGWWGVLNSYQFTHQYLRVLCLAGFSNRELPRSIGNLKHLRLLDLTNSTIVRLPDSITSLYNLQTLILVGCVLLRDLPKDMGDLVNLRHLFLPYIPEQEMPLRIGCLTNLQKLNEFKVGLHTRIGELRDLSQLLGRLRISNLERVGNINGIEEAILEANLKNKPHLRKLELCWSSDNFPNSRDAKVEENLLDQLQPHTNLEILRIDYYGGTRFPSWVGHPSFSNLAIVALHGCHKCVLLPSLRQLPSLKHLKIEGCSAMNISGSELCGDDDLSVNKKFRSLETLVIREMTEWEEWEEVVEEEQVGEEFPCLHKLTIEDCPKLRRFSHPFCGLVTLRIENCNALREIPQLLPSLQYLMISCCEKFDVLPRVPSIQLLSLHNCPQLTTLSDDSQHLSSSSLDREADQFSCLRDLSISRCPNMRKLPCILPSLVRLVMEYCEELPFLPMLPSIKTLKLKSMQCNEMVLEKVSHLSSLSSLHEEGNSNLSSLPSEFFQHLTRLKRLEIHDFSELMMMVGLQHLTSLARLVIFKCPKLVSLTNNEEEEQRLLLPFCLQYLKLSNCDNLQKLPQSLCNLRCLTQLIIEGATRLACFPKELHTLMSLHKLKISSCPNLVSLAEMKLPIGLQSLHIKECRNLKSLPDEMHMLTSFFELQIYDCPVLESFPDMGLPTTLNKVWIQNCGKLISPPKGLYQLTNLQELEIVECSFLTDCKNIESLQNLTSILSLSIGGCPNLVSIPKGVLPTCLREFCIINCPILKTLHGGLSDLTHLTRLNIGNCPIIKKLYQKKEGEDQWSNITPYAQVYIDDEQQ
ncbi:hypothetical protein NE237_023472 [Protea cynaroides]|uniref:Uncharacterized protein n=1 Tax=Protea cynaroides TaxID=273540 RepID=A0A9Q0HF21_9MAGN|nr:hypothetical protein NE237_023472 [Protea cynaroides]